MKTKTFKGWKVRVTNYGYSVKNNDLDIFTMARKDIHNNVSWDFMFEIELPKEIIEFIVNN